MAGRFGASIATQTAATRSSVAVRVRSGRDQMSAVNVAAIDWPATATTRGKSSVYGVVTAATYRIRGRICSLRAAGAPRRASTNGSRTSMTPKLPFCRTSTALRCSSPVMGSANNR